jgi:hypothetical protein
VIDRRARAVNTLIVIAKVMDYHLPRSVNTSNVLPSSSLAFADFYDTPPGCASWRNDDIALRVVRIEWSLPVLAPPALVRPPLPPCVRTDRVVSRGYGTMGAANVYRVGISVTLRVAGTALQSPGPHRCEARTAIGIFGQKQNHVEPWDCLRERLCCAIDVSRRGQPCQ